MGVDEHLLPPRIEPGAMQTVGADNTAVRAAREAHELVEVTPATDFFLNWHGAVESFRGGIARLVTLELRDHWVATGHPV